MPTIDQETKTKPMQEKTHCQAYLQNHPSLYKHHFKAPQPLLISPSQGYSNSAIVRQKVLTFGPSGTKLTPSTSTSVCAAIVFRPNK